MSKGEVKGPPSRADGLNRILRDARDRGLLVTCPTPLERTAVADKAAKIKLLAHTCVGLTRLLFSYKGRIGRLHGWVASLAVGAATSPIIPIFEFAAKGHAAVDPDTQHIEPIGLLGLAVLVVGLVNLWVCFALIVKRLHDRDRTGWRLVWHFLIMLLAMVLIKVAIAVPKEQALWYALAGGVAIAGIAAAAVSIWLFVEIGLLSGTPGPNRFGPKPEDHASRKSDKLLAGPPVMA